MHKVEPRQTGFQKTFSSGWSCSLPAVNNHLCCHKFPILPAGDLQRQAALHHAGLRGQPGRGLRTERVIDALAILFVSKCVCMQRVSFEEYFSPFYEWIVDLQQSALSQRGPNCASNYVQTERRQICLILFAFSDFFSRSLFTFSIENNAGTSSNNNRNTTTVPQPPLSSTANLLLKSPHNNNNNKTITSNKVRYPINMSTIYLSMPSSEH